jgi:hypothetical protein
VEEENMKKLLLLFSLSLLFFAAGCSEDADEVATFSTAKVNMSYSESTTAIQIDITKHKEEPDGDDPDEDPDCIVYGYLNESIPINISVTRIPNLPETSPLYDIMLRGYNIVYKPISVMAYPLDSIRVETQLLVTSGQQVNFNVLTIDSINALFNDYGRIYRYTIAIEADFVELQSDIQKTIPLYLDIEVGDINTEENDTCS